MQWSGFGFVLCVDIDAALDEQFDDIRIGEHSLLRIIKRMFNKNVDWQLVASTHIGKVVISDVAALNYI